MPFGLENKHDMAPAPGGAERLTIHYLHFAHCDSTACLLKHFKLYSRPLWLTSSPMLPQHGGVSPQRMIECIWRRSFDDAIDSDIVMTLLGRLTASILIIIISVC